MLLYLDEHILTKFFIHLHIEKKKKHSKAINQITHGGVGLLRGLVCEQNRLAEICVFILMTLHFNNWLMFTVLHF